MSYQEHVEPSGRVVSKPVFGRAALPQLLQSGGTGFHQTEGFHIYCELRASAKLKFAENDANALKYIQAIEEFVNHGVQAAGPFNIALLELQENVLHFYKEAPLTVDTAIEAIQFVFLFTTVLYQELKPDLKDGWEGFASCIAHGPAIIVGHQSFGNSSVVSLGPSACRPAKQLLYGKTPAGCVDVPGEWAKALGGWTPGNWFTINLRDREKIPYVDRMDNSNLRAQLLERIRAYRADKNRPRISSIGKANRIQASCVQADLDGFSATVEEAFQAGRGAVEKVAMGFAKILEFGDFMQQSTPGAVGMPWAGDRAPTLVPKHLWLDFSMRWQNFAAGTAESEKAAWAKVFQKVGWAIGACHGKSGSNIVMPIDVQGRHFQIATGWPAATSMEAQNLGKSGDILTHHLDHAELDAATRSLFSKVQGTEFWKTTNATPETIRKAAVEIGKAAAPAATDYSSKYESIQVPSPRPHYQ